MSIINNKNKAIKYIFKIFWKPVLWAIIIGILSCMPANDINNQKWTIIHYQDKILHFIFYCILSLFLLTALLTYFKKLKPGPKIIILSLSLVLFYGSVLEIIQYQLISTREGDVIDVLFNMAGYAIAIILVYFIPHFSKKIL